jgi:hypothetical protein
MDQMTRDEGKEVLAVLKDMSDAPAMPGETKSAGHETTAADPETTPADSETVEPEVVEGEIVDDEIADEAAGRRTRRIDAISALIAEGPLPRAYVSTMLERQFGKTINQMDDAELDSFIAWYGDEAKKISGEG